jgi:hypothetical protein
MKLYRHAGWPRPSVVINFLEVMLMIYFKRTFWSCGNWEAEAGVRQKTPDSGPADF